MQMSTSISLNLNFVLYIRNLFLSEENEYLFPWLPIDKDVFLPPKEFNAETEHLWDIIFTSCVDEHTDSIHWNAKNFNFSKLFRSEKDAETNLAVIEKCYSSWFWHNWKVIADLYLRGISEKYYHSITEYGNQNKLTFAEPYLTLQFVYTSPPIDWNWYNHNSIILSLEIDLMQKDQIIEKLKQLCFGNVLPPLTLR